MNNGQLLTVPGSTAKVLVIDDFIPGAKQLIDYAVNQPSSPASGGLYPGLRTPAPPGYIKYSLQKINQALAQHHQQQQLTAGESYFSMVTTREEDLSPAQCMPHIDRPKPTEYAVVHYLCRPPHGGTSFYQFTPTGQSLIAEHDYDEYLASLASHVADCPPSSHYINGDSKLFKRLLSVDCQFNRAVIYPCALLHSGNIPHPFTPDLNPFSGRFTVTSFFR
ncbi:DUF6445 family protein [Alteromonas gilva]|uniref:DUF6445 family protein n=1 Tax=Alteromonas gilva TaxID=2987522 RepID=A0ABT5L7E8_9ALTE|nr:DUF6445 family protein [Alteromonas gilva]MDC8832296.1 DUF6445 family protein [Alteromonas gilva]